MGCWLFTKYKLQVGYIFNRLNFKARSIYLRTDLHHSTTGDITKGLKSRSIILYATLPYNTCPLHSCQAMVIKMFEKWAWQCGGVMGWGGADI